MSTAKTLSLSLGALLLLCAISISIACGPASPSAQTEGEQPTPTPERKVAAEPTPTVTPGPTTAPKKQDAAEPTATAEPEPEPTSTLTPKPTPEPTPDPAKLSPESHILIALRDAIAAHEEAATNQGDGARSVPTQGQPPINFGVPIPTSLTAYISTITADSVEAFLTGNGGTVIERRAGPETGLNPASIVATVVTAEFPTTLLEDLARQDDILYVLLSDGLYPRLGSGLREKVAERAEQLLTPEGRAVAPPETNGIAVDATKEGYANIRAFLIANNWDFTRNSLYPDFDLIAPMSALHGVLYVYELPSSKFLMILPPDVPAIC